MEPEEITCDLCLETFTEGEGCGCGQYKKVEEIKGE